jgi:hypothetical protein
MLERWTGQCGVEIEDATSALSQGPLYEPFQGASPGQ